MAIELDIPDIKVLVRTDPNYNVVIQNPRSSVYRSGSYISVADTAVTAISSSFATTASYALNAGGGGFPYSGSGEITGSLEITENLTVLGNVSSSTAESNAFLLNAGTVSIVFTGSINTGIFGVSEYIEPAISTTTYSGATIEYMAQRPGASRMGMILATWTDNSNIIFTDISTADVGDTSDISFVFLPSSGYYRLRVNSGGTGSGAWTVQSLFKLFPNLT